MRKTTLFILCKSQPKWTCMEGRGVKVKIGEIIEKNNMWVISDDPLRSVPA